MIFRLSQKLNTKLKTGKLATLPLNENPYADWSCHVFTVDRKQYVILCNTASMYSCVMPAKGLTSGRRFTEAALRAIGEFMTNDGEHAAYQKFIAASADTITFAKALNRSVTGSMNELIMAAKQEISWGEETSDSVGFYLNDFILSALATKEDRDYGKPKDAFQLLASKGTPMRQPSQTTKNAGTTESAERSKSGGPIPASQRVYQFKITLLRFDPPIWRRIQVKNCSLDRLHEHIQDAMGWENMHLHQFTIQGDCYGNPAYIREAPNGDPSIDSTETKISDILPENGRRFRFIYEYDFGDEWRHEILFERCIQVEKGQKYPLCIAGKMACPPEDIGGVWGYAEFLDATIDPRGTRFEGRTEWLSSVDPEEFDVETATKRMR